MKLLKTELEQIIKEEIDKFLNEAPITPGGTLPGALKSPARAAKKAEEPLQNREIIDTKYAQNPGGFASRNWVKQHKRYLAKLEAFKKAFDKKDIEDMKAQGMNPEVLFDRLTQTKSRGGTAATRADAYRELKKFKQDKAAKKQSDVAYDQAATQAAQIDQYEREKALEPTMSLEPQSREEKLAAAGLSADNPLGIPMMPTKGKSKSKKRPSSKAAKQNALSKRTGRSVASIQKMFKELFPKNSRSFRRGKPDGQYGGETEKVIKAVQAQLGLKQDGLWGPGTEKAWLAADAKTKSIASSGATTQQTAQAVAKKPAVPLAKLQAAAEKAALDVRRMRLPGGGVPYGRPEYVAAKNKADQLAKVYQFALQKSKANKQVAGTPTPQ